MPSLFVERAGAVATIRISNPAKYNAMTTAMWEDLPRQLQALDADDSIRVIVLEGDGGKAFVSGADISELEQHQRDAEEQIRFNRSLEDAYLSPTRCAKPVVAKIRGICMGGGLGLAAACDLRICSTDARFRMPAARLGVGYTSIGVRRFLQVIGLQHTMDLFLSARIVDAREALAMGFVARVCEPEQLDQAVSDWCAQVAANAPLTLRALKLTVNDWLREPALHVSDQVEAAIQRCFDSEDYREGARAFMEKRPARFQGR
jgi:enoyl-CoA hydratase/carnithine racemase